MHKEFLMGNEAIAMGALAAGLNVIAGYPGTPSTEVLETVAKRRGKDVYVEWSVNEKAGMEVAAGAAYSGARSMVTMKQVGLNVASDPLMSLAYIGVKGAMVVMVADDPGPISSQTEQDTRTFASYSKLPCFDPSSVQEAYDMIQEAMEFSERYHTPVIFRPTTRVCHAYASIDVKDENECASNEPEGFVKDPSKWVIFPRLSYRNHIAIEARNEEISEVFSEYARNEICGDVKSRKGIATNGAPFANVMESLPSKVPKVLKVATPFPFPEKLAVEFLKDLDEVLCIEELDPVIERNLIFVCGKYNLKTKIRGMLTHDIVTAGEKDRDMIRSAMAEFMGCECPAPVAREQPPELPVRPPVLCAGCPHRASFLAVKEATKGKKTVYCGDIGCYTLGNAMPLDMVDTCLCMGAGITISQGIGRVAPDTECFAFAGDSTFFASAMTGVVNAVYNQAELTVIILDNSTTAMTGHQPHPGTGRTMMGEIVEKVDIVSVLKGIGVQTVETADPLKFDEAVETVKRVSSAKGVKAIIFRSPCIALFRPESHMEVVSEKCIGCKRCIKNLGCPAISLDGKKAVIDPMTCNACGLCTYYCKSDAIRKVVQ
ncbi:MAG: indolepyruvate ferredoxin oxidoreductase subunit alpha [Candidatus Methanomethylophilaceae archaeon]|nr:indolepyruvate ferredoxin oxidoreductase subunit alpha [Candidatus Methanomethylophilaceae archaeon]